MKPTRRIVYATDFSAASRAALQAALDWARTNHAEMVVLHVLPPPEVIMGDGFVAPATMQQIDVGRRRAAMRHLERLAASARKAGVRASTRLVDGQAAEQIVRTADRLRADMIVLGTHGRSGLSRLFMGSVAARVVAMSRRPVLTVRAGRQARRAA